MTLISEITKKISVAELLTILFILSVGISLLYKYGFYEALGISWYIFTLSPQQLFLSSINLIFFSILGIIMGFFNSLYNEKYWEVSLVGFIAITVIAFLSTLVNFPLLSRGLYILTTSATLVMSAINFFIYSRKTAKENIHENYSFIKKAGYPIMSIIIIAALLGVVYYEGGQEADRYSLLSFSKSIVKLKDKTEGWVLIEMNGDKVLLMKQLEGKRVFKIVEYKEVDEIISEWNRIKTI